jgi:hypothetical protein
VIEMSPWRIAHRSVRSSTTIHVDDSLLETPKNERREVSVGCDGQSVRVLV